MKSLNYFTLIKKLDKYNFITIIFFLSGFLISILDFSILRNFEIILSNTSNLIFISLYILSIFILFFITKSFILISSTLNIKKENTRKEKYFKTIKNFLIGYYLGYIINISNAFIIIFFEKFIIQ
jgi:hypothetical protein